MPVHLLPPERAARVRELHALRRTLAEIAAEFAVSRSTAGAWHKMLGLTANRPPTPHEAFWTPERVVLARRLAVETGINTAAARELGCSVNLFRAEADARGWPRRDLHAERVARADAKAVEVKRLKSEGMRPGEIARRMGLGDSSIAEFLRRAERVADGATPATGDD